MTTQVGLREKSLRLQHEARAVLQTANETNATDVEAQFDRMIAEADALEARAKRFDDLEAREAALNVADERRERTERKVETGTATIEERQASAFNAYLRGSLTGEQRSILSELRAQSVGTPSEGGYTVPQTWAAGLITGMKAYGPLVDDSVVTFLRTAGGGQMNFGSQDDTANEGAWIDENTQVGSASFVYGTKALNAYKLTSNAVLISSELISDAGIDIQATVTAAMAERLGRSLNKRATTGTGSDQINGIATAAGAGVTLALANSAITADDLISLQHSVDPAYRSNAGFMLNDATVAKIRKLKDTNGAYIWQPGLSVAAPATILGQAFHVNQDMANVGTGAKSVLYGDFKRYTVRQAGGFEVKRLVERYADYDQVGFIAFARYDGELMDSRAIKALVNP